MYKMKMRECLKILSEIKPNRKVNISSLARKTNCTEAQVKKALKILAESEIISHKNNKLKFNFYKLN